MKRFLTMLVVALIPVVAGAWTVEVDIDDYSANPVTSGETFTATFTVTVGEDGLGAEHIATFYLAAVTGELPASDPDYQASIGAVSDASQVFEIEVTAPLTASAGAYYPYLLITASTDTFEGFDPLPLELVLLDAPTPTPTPTNTPTSTPTPTITPTPTLTPTPTPLAPEIEFVSVTPTSGEPPLTVELVFEATSTVGGGFVAIWWEFPFDAQYEIHNWVDVGGGVYSCTGTLEHEYIALGTYTAAGYATDSWSVGTPATQEITVSTETDVDRTLWGVDRWMFRPGPMFRQ